MEPDRAHTDPHDDADGEEFLAAARTGTVSAYWERRFPDLVLIRSDFGDVTSRELEQLVNRIARAFRAAGLAAGDGIAVLLPNRPELLAVYLAAMRTGLRMTPINWHLSADEVAYIVSDCQAKAFVADHRYADAAAGSAPGAALRLSTGGDIDGFVPLAEAVAGIDGSMIDDPVQGQTMNYTSGTTGRPKGVLKPVPPVSIGLRSGAGNRPGIPPLGFVPGESVSLVTGPLYHAAPMFFSAVMPLTAGASLILMDKWDSERALALIEQYRVTHSHLVPTMFRRLLALPAEVRARYDVSSLVYVWHGAAPCPVDDKKAMIEWWGPKLLEYFSSTEGAATYVASPEWLLKPGTVGKPEPSELIVIVDDDGKPVPPMVPGTIMVKAGVLGRFEYFNDPEKTAKAFRGEYYSLGDVGYLDHDGFLFPTDRSADLIISGGVNIYPAEVEAALLTHPAVRDVAVVGVPDDEWGEKVLAAVEVNDGYEAGAALAGQLVAHCRNTIAHYKCPKQVEFTESLGRTPTGKLQKVRLREEYRALVAAQARES